MGGSLGATVAGLSPDIDRYALGVCAMDLPVMMPRAYGWDAIELFFKQGYPARIDRDLLVVMSAEEWDLVEDSPFAPHLLQDPLPGSQVAHLLFQIGLYDSSSTNVASEIAGRTLGLPELSPTAHAVWGLAQQAAPLDSGYVVYDMGATPLPEGTQAPSVDNGVHEARAEGSGARRRRSWRSSRRGARSPIRAVGPARRLSDGDEVAQSARSHPPGASAAPPESLTTAARGVHRLERHAVSCAGVRRARVARPRDQSGGLGPGRHAAGKHAALPRASDDAAPPGRALAGPRRPFHFPA